MISDIQKSSLNKEESSSDSESNDSESNDSKSDDEKHIISNKEANNNSSSRPNEVPVEESIGETGRLFVRNLPYICTEEDLRKEFIKFGPLAEVNINFIT